MRTRATWQRDGAPQRLANVALPVPVTFPEPQRPEKNGGARPRVQSAARVVEILLAVSRSATGLRAKEIAEEVGLSQQVTYHLLHTLLETGILRKDERNHIVAGMRMATLLEGYRRQIAAPEWFAAILREVAQETGQIVYAVGWLGGEIAVLNSARGKDATHAAEVPHGFCGHAHARASGKALLAFAPPLRCAEYLRGHCFTRLTARTITDGATLRRELERIRARGYSVDREEFAEGMSCVALPLASNPAYVVSVSAPTPRFEVRLADYLQILRRRAGYEDDGRGGQD